jgi:hypothetical protein
MPNVKAQMSNQIENSDTEVFSLTFFIDLMVGFWNLKLHELPDFTTQQRLKEN